MLLNEPKRKKRERERKKNEVYFSGAEIFSKHIIYNNNTQMIGMPEQNFQQEKGLQIIF